MVLLMMVVVMMIAVVIVKGKGQTWRKHDHDPQDTARGGGCQFRFVDLSPPPN